MNFTVDELINRFPLNYVIEIFDTQLNASFRFDECTYDSRKKYCKAEVQDFIVTPGKFVVITV